MTGSKRFCYAGVILALGAIFTVSSWADPVADELSGKLVVRQGNDLVLAPPDILVGKTVIALYYSTYGPICRKFTPTLLQFYRAASQRFPNFQLVMVCRYAPASPSEEEMRKYIVETGMTWPILTFGNAANVPLAQKFAASSVPHLVIVDAEGNKLIATAPGEDASSLALENLAKLLDPSFATPSTTASASSAAPSPIQIPVTPAPSPAPAAPSPPAGPNDYYVDGQGTEYMPGYQPRGAKLMHRAPAGTAGN